MDVSGFSWAENLAFDGNESLFVSDTTQGVLYRISLSQDGQEYERVVHVAKGVFKKMNGLAMHPNTTTLYAAVTLQATGDTWIAAIDTTTPNRFDLLVKTPVMGNGLAYHIESGKLYTTNEGNFIPGRGVVYSIDLVTNTTSKVATKLEGADGAFIDQARGLLYISEVNKATVVCYTIQPDTTLTEAFRFVAPDMVRLDDFCLSANGDLVYGADYRNGTIVVFQSDGTSTSGVFLMAGLQNPTSVRFSVGAGFNSTSVFVSEGGGLTSFTKDRNVLQSPYALPSGQ